MPRSASEHPTELELQILRVLWRKSPQHVRDVRKCLAAGGKQLAHTSVITTLNTMVEKGYLKRVMEGNAYLFSPRVKREVVSRRMLGDIVNRVFDGSAKAVMLSLFDCAEIDSEELRELRQLIDCEAKKRK